ncbi:MAG TPA: cell division protein ZapA [Candidatus Krumholzibacteria bacterium]|nr:cell division protein ZapA [Candidatus Krumholzibacteria bacterium]HPD71517.1 cell division protein ZapA [Candidatus Krumholzibacteria bacterium]HRY41550.1 cell division protein ZapA [Candidatus Krumholzibacteria bacterium]
MSIFGSRYTLRSDADPAFVAELAVEVDARMREAASAGAGSGAERLAVLAALNLADDLARERRARSEETAAIHARASRILAILNDEVGREGVEGV